MLATCDVYRAHSVTDTDQSRHTPGLNPCNYLTSFTLRPIKTKASSSSRGKTRIALTGTVARISFNKPRVNPGSNP